MSHARTSKTRRVAAGVLFVGVAGVLAALSTAANAQDAELPEIAYTKRVLDNGLTVIVHEDHKAPVVGVNIWYHVGSKNELPGRTGFAHLFEHLMFNGSENADDDWFVATAAMGATDVNGTTSQDRTNYFQTVPKGALDRTLWLESDRMGHLLGAIDQGKLDEQRGVVQNEKRQGENNPYGGVWQVMQPLLYPVGHPYSWRVIGSMDDLNAATLDDVRAWFRAYYGAANAVLVICGDVETEQAFEKAAHYFGDIAPGPPVTRPESWVAKRRGTQRISIEEHVPQARIHYVWNTPERGADDSRMLELAANVLARGESSRLYKRLVKTDAIATDVVAFQDAAEIGGAFHVWATAADGIQIADVETALREELARLLETGPTDAELQIEKIQVRASFLRRIERVGFFGGKANLLASSEVFGGSPDAWRERMCAIAAATPEAVRQAAQRWLSDGALVVETQPIASHTTAATGAPRDAPPAVESAPAALFPKLERTTLTNGLTVLIAPRTGTDILQFDVVVRGGRAADPTNETGTAYLVGSLLRAGTATRSASEISTEVDALGAQLSIATEVDTTRITFSALRESVAPSLALLADVVLHPNFPANELEVRRRSQIAAIAQERVAGWPMLNRVLPLLLFGSGHPHSVPSTGTGNPDVVARLSQADLRAFHARWFRPANTTLVVTGDVALADLLPLVEEGFGEWGGAATERAEIATGPIATSTRVILLDRPGAPQSIVVAAQLAPPRGGADELPFLVLNGVLGGGFVSRLNMNLRADKHWSYGARSMLFDMDGQRILSAGASVQTDKTAESLLEIHREMLAIAGERPPTAAEIATAKSTLTLTLPGRWETTGAVANSVVDIVTFGLADTYFDGYAERVLAVSEADLVNAAKAIHPEGLVYVVIGDLSVVEESVRALELGDAAIIDTNGAPVGSR